MYRNITNKKNLIYKDDLFSNLSVCPSCGFHHKLTCEERFKIFFDNKEYEVLEKRESKTREGQGIVTIKTTGTNQDGKVVCTFKRQILIPFEGHAVEDNIENY